MYYEHNPLCSHLQEYKKELLGYWSKRRLYFGAAKKYTLSGVNKAIAKIPGKYDVPPAPQPVQSTPISSSLTAGPSAPPQPPPKDRYIPDNSPADISSNAEVLKLTGTVHNNLSADGLATFVNTTFDLVLHDVSIQF